MTKNLFVWNSASAFESGAQENVCVNDGALILSDANGRFLPAGCYTTAEVKCPAFTALVASWNTDTPLGTAVEIQVRVRAQSAWSTWLSYGKWSPFIARASAPRTCNAPTEICIDTDTVTIAGAGADAFQLRVFLYSDNPHAAPIVALLSASVRYAHADAQRGVAINRSVPVPSYSQSIRDTRIANRICAPTTITMLINRYGEDVLPEETALASYDYASLRYGNQSFAAALAGCFGYECTVRFCDVAALKNEIKHGFGCGARVSYTNSPITAAEKNLPLLQGATCTTEGHWLVVHGFAQDDDGSEYVLVNDPYGCCDAAAQRRYLLDEFIAAWSGVAIFMHTKTPRATLSPLYRVNAELHRADFPCEYALYRKGFRQSLPTNFSQKDDVCTGCVCFALHDQHAYATTAHKFFFYAEVSQNGNLSLDTKNLPAGTKLTVFVIGAAGLADVAELTV